MKISHFLDKKTLSIIALIALISCGEKDLTPEEIEKARLLKIDKQEKLDAKYKQAIKKRNYKKAINLLDDGADIDRRISNELRVFSDACNPKNDEHRKLFLALLAFDDTVKLEYYLEGRTSTTSFYQCLTSKSHDVASVFPKTDKFIELGFDINSLDEKNKRIFFRLSNSSYTRLETMKYLIYRGVNVNLKNEDGYRSSPLKNVLKFGSKDELKLLLDAGADPSVSFQDESPLAGVAGAIYHLGSVNLNHSLSERLRYSPSKNAEEKVEIFYEYLLSVPQKIEFLSELKWHLKDLMHSSEINQESKLLIDEKIKTLNARLLTLGVKKDSPQKFSVEYYKRWLPNAPYESFDNIHSWSAPRIEFEWTDARSGQAHPSIYSMSLDGSDIRKAVDSTLLSNIPYKHAIIRKRSPNNQLMALEYSTLSNENVLALIDIKNKKLQVLFKGQNKPKSVWSYDSNILYFHDSSNLYEYNLLTKKVTASTFDFLRSDAIFFTSPNEFIRLNHKVIEYVRGKEVVDSKRGMSVSMPASYDSVKLSPDKKHMLIYDRIISLDHDTEVRYVLDNTASEFHRIDVLNNSYIMAANTSNWLHMWKFDQRGGLPYASLPFEGGRKGFDISRFSIINK